MTVNPSVQPDGADPDRLALLKSMLEQRLHALESMEATQASDAELPVAEVESSPLDRATVRLLNDLSREAAGHHAAEVQVLRHALAKFEDGSYGLCEECGQPIGASRLLARPEARLCIGCQTRAEQRH
ncbi:TraR/DksA family transcriptional regulator [Massilia sp. WF1]|uniref:TraR/DksA family transcriptional regulator n=1 Tax=unclassified Massilia TaxID=2609279 RepID=UPI0006493FBF|nr:MULTISPECIES: TraR/DksA C4-type zinc finger protein [unclassified Massilia]ALK96519.1 TraR/DksA family transcriptional regulator [Massilia sp. WG5]KLU36312.1 TraR/DksA family transcriptional regulator [Massilia sp. WF1]